jgi:hypothetical protein
MGLLAIAGFRGNAYIGAYRSEQSCLFNFPSTLSRMVNWGGVDGRDAFTQPGLEPSLANGPPAVMPQLFYPMLGDIAGSRPPGATGWLPGNPQILMVPIPTVRGALIPMAQRRNISFGLRAQAFAEARTAIRSPSPTINQAGR